MEFKLPDTFAKVKIFSSEVSDGPMNRLLKEGRDSFRKFLKKIGANKPLASGGQPRHSQIEIIKKSAFYLNADGLLTKGDYVLAVKTADCIPLLLYDPETFLIGAIHVSRKNLISGIIGKSLKNSLKKLKTNPLSVKIFLGPHIRQKNYDLKEDSYRPLLGTKWESFLKNKNSKRYFDLTGAAIDELEAIGIIKDNIYDSKVDTFSSDMCFSARRSKGIVGVFATVIFKK